MSVIVVNAKISSVKQIVSSHSIDTSAVSTSRNDASLDTYKQIEDKGQNQMFGREQAQE